MSKVNKITVNEKLLEDAKREIHYFFLFLQVTKTNNPEEESDRIAHMDQCQ
jgi:hypothetical protein